MPKSSLPHIFLFCKYIYAVFFISYIAYCRPLFLNIIRYADEKRTAIRYIENGNPDKF